MPSDETVDLREMGKIINAVKPLAKRYRELTGRPLGITGEVAEYEAARLLRLRLASVRQAGYDATRGQGPTAEKLQIKGRCLLEGAKPGQRLGKIQREKVWDAVLLVLVDKDFEPVSIYEARRSAVIRALSAPGSKARNERGALSVSKFKQIGKVVWLKTSAEKPGPGC